MAIDSTRTAIKVCSNALTLLGVNEISDFTSSGNQPAGGICDRLYFQFKKSLYAQHPWKFCLKKLQLTKDSVPPINQWTNQFLFPGDRIENSPYSLYDTDAVGAPPMRKFEIFGERLMTEATDLWMDYVHNADESLWPEDFAEFVEVALAARLAIPITGDRVLKDGFDIEAYGDPSRPEIRGMFQAVKTSNLAGSPVITFADTTLADARFGGLHPIPGGENFIF